MTKRKFYKTTITVEILSEEPQEFQSLEDVAYQITDGHSSGVWVQGYNEELNGKQIAEALLKQGTDPEFFLLNEEGDDIE